MRRLLTTLVVLALLALAVDRGGAYAASQAAIAGAKNEGAGEVNVRILGFPFLTQVAAGTLSTVTVSERSVTADGITVDHLYAIGHGVHLAFSDVVRGRVKEVPIDTVTGSAVISYATFQAAIDKAVGIRAGLDLTVGPASDPGDVVAHLTGPLGFSVSQTVPVPTVAGGKLQLGAFVARFASFVPGSVTDHLSIALPALPYGLQLGQARARADGIAFTVKGTNIAVPTAP